jgi:hypothetical protein
MAEAAHSTEVSNEGTFADRLNEFAKEANRIHGPFWAFVVAGLIGGALAAFMLGPWLMATAWSVHADDWPGGAKICFFLAAVTLVAVLLGVANLFLRLLDCQALQFSIPLLSARLRGKRPPVLETWSGLAALAIGMLIGETIFT